MIFFVVIVYIHSPRGRFWAFFSCVYFIISWLQKRGIWVSSACERPRNIFCSLLLSFLFQSCHRFCLDVFRMLTSFWSNRVGGWIIWVERWERECVCERGGGYFYSVGVGDGDVGGGGLRGNVGGGEWGWGPCCLNVSVFGSFVSLGESSPLAHLCSFHVFPFLCGDVFFCFFFCAIGRWVLDRFWLMADIVGSVTRRSVHLNLT